MSKKFIISPEELKAAARPLLELPDDFSKSGFTMALHLCLKADSDLLVAPGLEVHPASLEGQAVPADWTQVKLTKKEQKLFKSNLAATLSHGGPDFVYDGIHLLRLPDTECGLRIPKSLEYLSGAAVEQVAVEQVAAVRTAFPLTLNLVAIPGEGSSFYHALQQLTAKAIPLYGKGSPVRVSKEFASVCTAKDTPVRIATYCSKNTTTSFMAVPRTGECYFILERKAKRTLWSAFVEELSPKQVQDTLLGILRDLRKDFNGSVDTSTQVEQPGTKAG